MNSLIGPSVPDSMIPDDIKSMLKSDHYELAFICSEYASATDQVNTQIAQIDDIVKSYDDDAMVRGSAFDERPSGCNGCRPYNGQCSFDGGDLSDHYDRI